MHASCPPTAYSYILYRNLRNRSQELSPQGTNLVSLTNHIWLRFPFGGGGNIVFGFGRMPWARRHLVGCCLHLSRKVPSRHTNDMMEVCGKQYLAPFPCWVGKAPSTNWAPILLSSRILDFVFAFHAGFIRRRTALKPRFSLALKRQPARV